MQRTTPSIWKHLFFSILTACILPAHIAAVPACPTPAIIKQPDGTFVKISLRGDEHRHWHEDADGYTTMQDAKGWWIYATTNAAGTLSSGSFIVGRDHPGKMGLPRHLKTTLTTERRVSGTMPNLSGPASNTPVAMAIKTGTMKNLVVLVQFPDKLATHTAAEYTNLFNQIGYTTDGASGSVKDFYNEVSRNRLNVDSVVADWVTVSQNYSYYGANDTDGNDQRPREMVQEALALLEARGFDFSQCDADGDGWVDGLTIIHAGGGEEYTGNNANYIWSHQWQLTTTITYDGKSMLKYHTEPERRGWDSDLSTWGITRIGVICHETGHFLGLPDLYDTTYASAGAGAFCLMAGGSWNGDIGSLPAHPSIYCKQLLEWVTPTIASSTGVYALPRIEDDTQALRINGNWPSTQYLLIENRQGYGFDAGLPGVHRGLLVWHIDKTRTSNDNASRYMVDLEEAGGTQDLQQNTNPLADGDDTDYYRSGNNTHFTDATSPNNLSYEGTPLAVNIIDVSATGNNMTLILQDTSPDPSLMLLSSTHADIDGGNRNGLIDPGESIYLTVAWTNIGASAASNISATIIGGTPGITVLQSSASYPTINASHVATNNTPFVYRVAKTVPAGTPITFTNVITAGAWVFTGLISRVVGRQLSSTNAIDSTNVQRNITDMTTIFITNNITLIGSNNISDINASVRINHTYDGDLILALWHPDGTEVILANRLGSNGDNFGSGTDESMVRTIFDDQAGLPISSGSAPFANSYRPETLLGILNNKAVNGAWLLRVTDAAPGDTGTVDAFGLTIVALSTQWLATVYNVSPVASNQTTTAYAGQTTNLILRGSDTDGDALTFRTNSLPLHGTLSNFNTNSGTIFYTATANYSGTDNFTFVVNDGYTNSAPATVMLNVAPPPLLTCTVVSARGGIWPGMITTNNGTTLTQFITNSPVANGVATQYVCISATVTGNTFTIVSPTNVTLTITNNATLVWLWQTQYRLNLFTNGAGQVTGAVAWFYDSSNAILSALAAPDWRFASWSGDTNGCYIAGTDLTAPMTRSRNLTATFRPVHMALFIIR